MSLNSALARMERALSKTPIEPLPEERHAVFPADESGFAENVRRLRLANLREDAKVCKHCGQARALHGATVPTPLHLAVTLVCPTASTFEWDGVEQAVEGAP
jgi:hypothetical protein